MKKSVPVTLAGAVMGAVCLAALTILPAESFWPSEDAFGTRLSDHTPLLLWSGLGGGILGAVTVFSFTTARHNRQRVRTRGLATGPCIAVLGFLSSWLLQARGAWPQPRAADELMEVVVNLGPLFVAWPTLIWSILLLCRGMVLKRNDLRGCATKRSCR